MFSTPCSFAEGPEKLAQKSPLSVILTIAKRPEDNGENMAVLVATYRTVTYDRRVKLCLLCRCL